HEPRPPWDIGAGRGTLQGPDEGLLDQVFRVSGVPGQSIEQCPEEAPVLLERRLGLGRRAHPTSTRRRTRNGDAPPQTVTFLRFLPCINEGGALPRRTCPWF